jgi:methylenetetrahydrofolate dehydrogenase (NADP+) / methenyltetrahydrofolate cyclohydrolase
LTMTETATALVLEGRTFAKEKRAALKAAVAEFSEKNGFAPGFAVVLVGDDPSSAEYAKALVKSANNLGMYAIDRIFPATMTATGLKTALAELNNDPAIHGISVQWPLPRHISFEQMTDALDPAKDVEGYHPLSTGRLYTSMDVYIPATPLGGIKLLEHYGYSVRDKTCISIGYGVTVGRPLVALLLQYHATVMVAHSRTPKEVVNHLCREADFVFTATGIPGRVTGDMIKPGAVVVDFGTNYVDGKMLGDVDFESVSKVAAAVTPTPGGTSVVTTVFLLENVLKAALKQRSEVGEGSGNSG